MNSRNSIKFTAISAGIAVLLTSSIAFADEHSAPEQFKVQPAAVYQAVHGQALAETLSAIAQRSGITFKINTELSQEVVNQSIAGDNWEQAIKSLLVKFNYITIQQGDQIKTVIITGSKSEAAKTVTAKIDNEDVIVVEPKFAKLPSHYQAFPAGSVTPVNLPVNAMMNVSDHASINLDLPMGQFNVAHDYTVNEADGSHTWVGYLADEGQGYRVFLSEGPAGVMGVVTTPDGSYNIESDKQGVYLVDTSKLQHAGFEGDSIVPSVTMMNSIAMNAASATTSKLQTAVNAAQTALNSANALVAKDTTLVNTNKALMDAAYANLTTATTKLASSQIAKDNALKAYAAKANSTNLAAKNAANASFIVATAVWNVANANYQAANKAYTTANNNLTTAKATVVTALANFNSAQAALTAANTPVTVTQTPASNSTTLSNTNVVDLMVVYTTGKQTQAYAKQRINLLVTASNQAYIDSNINMQLRLVHTEATTYPENTSNSLALQDLSNASAQFANINQTRNQYGADLVFLFRPLYAKTAGSCGTTYVEFAGGSSANANLGFGTISDGNAVDQSGSYCAANTFTHEIGHSLGLVHEREYTSYPGVFNYSYAWGVQGSFGTIMSYKTPVLMYFSTPTLATKCAGQACGYDQSNATQSSDQTSSVNYTAPIIAGFMPTTVSTPVLN